MYFFLEKNIDNFFSRNSPAYVLQRIGFSGSSCASLPFRNSLTYTFPAFSVNQLPPKIGLNPLPPVKKEKKKKNAYNTAI